MKLSTFNCILLIFEISKHKNKRQDHYFDEDYTPHFALVCTRHNLLQPVVNFHHFLVGIVDIYLEGIKHFVLMGHFCTEVLILMFDILDDTTKGIQLIILCTN